MAKAGLTKTGNVRLLDLSTGFEVDVDPSKATDFVESGSHAPIAPTDPRLAADIPAQAAQAAPPPERNLPDIEPPPPIYKPPEEPSLFEELAEQGKHVVQDLATGAFIVPAFFESDEHRQYREDHPILSGATEALGFGLSSILTGGGRLLAAPAQLAGKLGAKVAARGAAGAAAKKAVTSKAAKMAAGITLDAAKASTIDAGRDYASTDDYSAKDHIDYFFDAAKMGAISGAAFGLLSRVPSAVKWAGSKTREAVDKQLSARIARIQQAATGTFEKKALNAAEKEALDKFKLQFDTAQKNHASGFAKFASDKYDADKLLRKIKALRASGNLKKQKEALKLEKDYQKLQLELTKWENKSAEARSQLSRYRDAIEKIEYGDTLGSLRAKSQRGPLDAVVDRASQAVGGAVGGAVAGPAGFYLGQQWGRNMSRSYEAADKAANLFDRWSKGTPGRVARRVGSVAEKATQKASKYGPRFLIAYGSASREAKGSYTNKAHLEDIGYLKSMRPQLENMANMAQLQLRMARSPAEAEAHQQDARLAGLLLSRMSQSSVYDKLQARGLATDIRIALDPQYALEMAESGHIGQSQMQVLDIVDPELAERIRVVADGALATYGDTPPTGKRAAALNNIMFVSSGEGVNTPDGYGIWQHALGFLGMGQEQQQDKGAPGANNYVSVKERPGLDESTRLQKAKR